MWGNVQVQCVGKMQDQRVDAICRSRGHENQMTNETHKAHRVTTKFFDSLHSGRRDTAPMRRGIGPPYWVPSWCSITWCRLDKMQQDLGQSRILIFFSQRDLRVPIIGAAFKKIGRPSSALIGRPTYATRENARSLNVHQT